LILNGSTSLDGLQNGDDLVLSESDFSRGDLLRGYNQYVGRSLKVNGPFCRDAYKALRSELEQALQVMGAALA
ncbi:hypothetical protein, partial [Pantoea ananatis]|uniref:hypothetical protein n=1 Tax=Pantoea ananas TaxID=553 RepID=UPI0021F7095B